MKPFEIQSALCNLIESTVSNRLAEVGQGHELVLARSMVSGAKAEAEHWEKNYLSLKKSSGEQIAQLERELAYARRDLLRAGKIECAPGDALRSVVAGADCIGTTLTADIFKAAAADREHTFAVLLAQVEQLKLGAPEIALAYGFMG
jgi:hypothetical protein